MIEPLESRIAPAGAINPTTATFIDVDGDQVTIKFSKPIAQQVLYTTTSGTPSIAGSEQLLRLNFINVPAAAAAGVNISFTAVPTDRNGDGIRDGDGRVNVGEIRADGKVLGAVTVPGDLGQVSAGASVGTRRVALAALSVGSLGEFELSTGATSIISRLAGDVGSITAAGNVRGAIALLDGLDNFSLGSLTIGGSLIGGSDLASGTVTALNIGTVKIRGNVQGGEIARTGNISAGKITSIAIGGSLLGGEGASSGIISASDIGTINLGRDLVGNQTANAEGSGTISASKLGVLSIRGSIIGGVGKDSGRVQVNGDVGSISIAGSIIGSGFASGSNSARISVGGNLGSIAVGGSLIGGTGDNSGQISANNILTATIRGDVQGGFGDQSGRLRAAGNLGSVSIGGSLVGGFDPDPTDLNFLGSGSGSVGAGSRIKQLTIAGSILGGSGDTSGTVSVPGTLDQLTVRGDIRGGTGSSSGSVTVATLGQITVGGSLVGGTDPNPSDGVVIGNKSGMITAGVKASRINIAGDIQGGSAQSSGRVTGLSVDSLLIGGSLLGGSGPNSGNISMLGRVPVLTIGGDVMGASNANDSGAISTQGGFGRITVGGSVIGGTNASRSGFINAGETGIESLVIGGDLRGGSSSRASVEDTGSVQGTLIGSITIGGSIVAGRRESTLSDSLSRSGSIHAAAAIGSLRVGGDIVGNETTAVVITAGGNPGAFPSVARPEPAIGSISVVGNVERTYLLAGYTRDWRGVSADVQVGPVRVGGDWIASTLVAGVTIGSDSAFGTADDRAMVGTDNFGAGNVRDTLAISRIASIVIAGQVKNGFIAGFRDDEPQTYGFVAQQIGSFSYGGIVVPLTAGASNDTFALGKARPLGASRSSLNADGFAMHVFEV